MYSNAPAPGSRSVQIQADRKTAESIDAMRHKHKWSLSELIRRSLALMEICMEHKAKGGEIIFRVRDSNGYMVESKLEQL